jgi:hypothetical protein
MSNEITPGYDATMAERVIREYADDTVTAAAHSLTDRECSDLGINTESCDVLQEVLGWGPGGIVTAEEQEKLSYGGFAPTFIKTLAGNDGKRALQARVKWLSLHLARQGAMDELEVIGPDAKEAIPLLLRALKNKNLDPVYRGKAAAVLGATMSEYIVSDLVTAMRDDNENVREFSAMALERMGEIAVAGLTQELEEGTAQTSSRAAAALAEIGAASVPFLTQVLEKGTDRARCYAAWALGSMTYADESAISALKNMAKTDPCWPCQDVAERALEKLGKKTYQNGF